MGLFLKILLAVVVVLAGVAISLFWWIKRRISRSIENYGASHALVDPRWYRPARIRLKAAHEIEPSEAWKALWREVHAQGFRPLADLAEISGGFDTFRLAKHQNLPFAAAIVESSEQPPGFVFFALSNENRLLAFSNGPEPALSNATVQWEVDRTLNPSTALTRLGEISTGLALRPMDARIARAIYEQAYAARIDAQLRLPFEPEAISIRASALNPQATPEQLSQAVEMTRHARNTQLSDALLDHYRRESKIDAVRWEDIREDLHVVHADLDTEELLAPLYEVRDAERVDGLAQQLTAQGYSGSALFEQVAAKLGAPAVFQSIRKMDRPVAASIYALDRDALLSGQARMHLYEAQDANEQTVSGALLATSPGDAKAQLQAMGLEQGKILSEATAMDDLDSLLITPESAAIAARANREPLLIGVLRAIWGNALLWALPALIVVWNLYQGKPYGWGDYLSFVVALVAMLLTVAIVAPMVLYHQLLKQRCRGQHKRAQISVTLLRRLNWLNSLPKQALDGEQAKLIANRSGTDAGIEYWKQFEADLSEEQYLHGLVQIYDNSGRFGQMIAAQRRLAEVSQTPDLAKIDLAMALARYQDNAAEAEELLAQVPAGGLSELAAAGYHFTRGLICATRAQHQHALNQFGQALQAAQQFSANPLVQAMIAEINGYVALTLRRSGDTAKADQLWQRVRPLIEVHATGKALIQIYEASPAG